MPAWHGVDVGFNARLSRVLQLNGPFTTSCRVTNTCAVVDTATTQYWTHRAVLIPVQMLGSYTLPWYGIQVSGTYQHPGAVADRHRPLH